MVTRKSTLSRGETNLRRHTAAFEEIGADYVVPGNVLSHASTIARVWAPSDRQRIPCDQASQDGERIKLDAFRGGIVRLQFKPDDVTAPR